MTWMELRCGLTFQDGQAELWESDSFTQPYANSVIGALHPGGCVTEEERAPKSSTSKPGDWI